MAAVEDVELTTQVVPHESHGKTSNKPLCHTTHWYLTKKRVFKKPVKVLGTIKRKEDPNAKCLCFPGTTLMNLWDIVLALLLVYTLIVLPLRLSFKVMDYPELDYAIDALFITDIFINFNAPFEDLEQRFMVTNRKRIACTYLKGWFFIDLISSFPFYIFSGDRVTQLLKAPKVLKSFRVFRILKMVKAVKFSRFISRLTESPKIHPAYARIVKLLFVVIMFAHFACCTWYYIGTEFSDPSAGEGWVAAYCGDDCEAQADWYMISLYWAITTLTTVGYGDIGPSTNAEMVFTIIMMLIGCSLFAYVTAALASIVQSEDESNQAYRKKMSSLRNFINNVEIDKELEITLLDTMAKEWRELDELRDLDWQELVVDPNLRGMVVDQIFGDLIAANKTLQIIGDIPELLTSTIAAFEPVTYRPKDFILLKNHRMSKFVFICHGNAAFSANTVAEFRKENPGKGEDVAGQSFGLVPLFLTGLWNQTCRATSTVTAFKLDLKFFADLLEKNELLENSVRADSAEVVVPMRESLYKHARANMESLQAQGLVSKEYKIPECPVSMMSCMAKLAMLHDKRAQHHEHPTTAGL